MRNEDQYTRTQMEIPKEIIEAAQKIQMFAAENGWRYWELLGICDRKFAYELREIKRDIRRPMQMILNHKPI